MSGSTVEITERFLESFALPPGEERARMFDSKLPGFGVTVGKLRTSFVVQRRVKGERSQSWVTLGHWAPGKLRSADPGLRDRTLTVALARGKAIEALGDMRKGADPRGEFAPGATSGGHTLRQGLELHTANMRKLGRSERSIETIETEVPRLLGPWMDRPMVDLSGAVLAALHDELTGDDKPYLANRIVAHVSAVWNALDKVHELDGRNPARAVTRNRYTPKRERVQDLADWYTKVQGLENAVRRDLQLFALCTGMRSEAARHVRWEHIDEERSALLVPKPKGGEAKAFTLPLGRRMIEMLRKRKRENAVEFDAHGGDHGWVFPSLSRARNDEGAFDVQPVAEPKEYRQKGSRKSAKVKFLPGLHSLRRTYLSVATEAGVGELDRHALANHAYGRQSVNATYISQAFDHLAECQAKIETALWKRLTAKR